MLNYTWLEHGMEALDTGRVFGSAEHPAAPLSGLAWGKWDIGN